MNTIKINSFENIPSEDSSHGKVSISNLIGDLIGMPITKTDDDIHEELSDKFQPIIDFPNFLLIALKITRMSENDFDATDFTLDDKELIDEFTKAICKRDTRSEKESFAKEFVCNLLILKFYLDNYTVHHVLDDRESQGDNPWQLQYYYKEDSSKSYPKNICEENKDRQIEMVHLLSMFEVAFTTKQRKNYLFYCMLYLFKDVNNCTPEKYLNFLRKLADKYFYDVYLDQPSLNEKNQPMPNAFDMAIIDKGSINLELKETDDEMESTFNHIYKQGRADIPLYVFNFMDYKLWKKYAEKIRGNKLDKKSKERKEFFEELGCSDFELDTFNSFYFSRTRKSLEHYYPQAKAGEGKPLSNIEIIGVR